jgi:MFS family permease
LGAIGAFVCYLLCALSPWGFLGLVGCAFTGFCVSMLWPGNLVVASSRFPHGGVFIYAMMASGGDLGASVAPQLVGIITDFAIQNPKILELATTLGLTGEQIGMKIGLLIGALFPIIAIPVYAHFRKKDKLKEKTI